MIYFFPGENRVQPERGYADNGRHFYGNAAFFFCARGDGVKSIIVIPARYASTRLPGKPLLRETGKYLIEHAYEAALRCKKSSGVVVATDDERIAEAVRGFGGRVAMTSPDHASGTDRIAEAVAEIETDVVINLQGDEPEMPAENIDAPFLRVRDEPILSFDGDNFVEDPFIWKQDDHYELIAKDMTGGITGEKHAGVHAVSDNAIDWRLAPQPKAYSRRVRWDDGTETVQGCLERPQLLFNNGGPTHLFAATADGPGGFRDAQNTWTMVIPLRRF